MKVKRPVVLIVEDDENDQYLLKAAFNKLGLNCPVLAVDNGEEAICYLKGADQYSDRTKYPLPTFLTTDLKMPKVNGFELLSFLKQNPHMTVIPTVVFTASADKNDITNAFLLGANAYHVKPHTFDELCKQIQILHDYWATCETPDIDPTGRVLPTEGSGKLSESVMEKKKAA